MEALVCMNIFESEFVNEDFVLKSATKNAPVNFSRLLFFIGHKLRSP